MFCLTLVLIFGLTKGISQDFNIEIVSPTSYQITGNTLHLEVRITASVEIVSAHAVVANDSVRLQFSPGSGSFKGQLALSDMAEDTLTAIITVIDPYKNVETKEIAFIYDNKPVITVIAPENNTITGPIFNIKATCVEHNGGQCNITECIEWF